MRLPTIFQNLVVSQAGTELWRSLTYYPEELRQIGSFSCRIWTYSTHNVFGSPICHQGCGSLQSRWSNKCPLDLSFQRLPTIETWAANFFKVSGSDDQVIHIKQYAHCLVLTLLNAQGGVWHWQRKPHLTQTLCNLCVPHMGGLPKDVKSLL